MLKEIENLCIIVVESKMHNSWQLWLHINGTENVLFKGCIMEHGRNNERKTSGRLKTGAA